MKNVTKIKLLVEEVRSKIKEIEDDDRFHYAPALVQINAPLALIQVDMKARHLTLKWVEERLNALSEM